MRSLAPSLDRGKSKRPISKSTIILISFWSFGPFYVAEDNAPPGPIGNADGGTSFSIWQAGWADLTTQNGNGPSHVSGVYTWSTYFAAWSPDGHYLAQVLYLAGRLSVPGQPSVSHQTLVDFQMERFPLLPVQLAPVG